MRMIDGLEVLNYRSVLGQGPQGKNKPTRLELEDDITTLIGKNEAGKSNMLSAINLLGDQYPISGDDLSSYESYNGPLRSVEILRCRLDPRVLNADAEDIKPIPWLLGPHSKDDLDGFPIRIPINEIPLLVDRSIVKPHEDQSAASSPSGQANPSAIGQALSKKNIEIVHYASGDHAVDMLKQDGTSVAVSTQQTRSNLELPMEIDDFLVERHWEYLHLCWWFIQNVVKVSELNPEVDEIDSIEPADLNDISEAHHAVKRQLEDISFAFDNATPIEEPDIDSDDEVTYESPEVSEIQRGADDLLRTLNNIFNPSDPLADLPNIIDQSQIELAKSEYNLREARSNLALQGLLGLDNIEITNYSSYDSPDLRTSLDNAVDRLSDYLNKFWEFDPVEGVSGGTIDPDETERYEFSYELDGQILRIRLSEEDGPPIPLDQRSDGMRWIITFLLKILAQPYDQSEGRQTLVILDDPGIHLHPEAEKQLFSAFFYITTQAQIVYSTHSPALIDSKEMARLRIIKRNTTQQEDDSIGTTVANNLDEAKTDGEQVDPLATAREAVGWTLSDSLFMGETTILVEGSSDKRYLNLFNSFFMHTGRTYIEDDPKFIDSKGLQLPFLSRILTSEDVTHVALMDDDTKNKDFEPDLENRTVRYDDMAALSDIEHDAEIEDLFDRELFIRAASDVHDELDVEHILDTPYDRVPCGVVDYIENFLSETDTDELMKGKISKNIKARLATELRENPEEYEETIKRFEAVIEELKTAFDDLDGE